MMINSIWRNPTATHSEACKQPVCQLLARVRLSWALVNHLASQCWGQTRGIRISQVGPRQACFRKFSDRCLRTNWEAHTKYEVKLLLYFGFYFWIAFDLSRSFSVPKNLSPGFPLLSSYTPVEHLWQLRN